MPVKFAQDLYTQCEMGYAYLVQVVVHCDELALQQLAARGCRAGGHIANIPDDGAVELIALQSHTATFSHAHRCRVTLPGSR
jgi:hypothetical protein